MAYCPLQLRCVSPGLPHASQGLSTFSLVMRPRGNDKARTFRQADDDGSDRRDSAVPISLPPPRPRCLCTREKISLESVPITSESDQITHPSRSMKACLEGSLVTSLVSADPFVLWMKSQHSLARLVFSVWLSSPLFPCGSTPSKSQRPTEVIRRTHPASPAASQVEHKEGSPLSFSLPSVACPGCSLYGPA